MQRKRRLSSFAALKFPVDRVKKLKKTEGVGSVYQETQHFSIITTVNGLRRIFYGNQRARVFWILVVISIFAFLIYQIAVLLQYYFTKPTVSLINFIANEGVMNFPAVTVCNLNPVRSSFIKKLNSSGELSDDVLNYLLATKTNSMYMFNNADIFALKKAHIKSLDYLANHPNFEIVEFLNSAQFDCDELFETCYYEGKQFDCCDYMTQSTTSLGKCWELNLQNGTEQWMRSPRILAKAGLQIVANSKQAEQFTDFQYSSFQENGFRYFIHPAKVNADLEAEGITVSPSRVVNSAIKTVLNDLLNRENWGNCTSTWPENYSSNLLYSAPACQALCVAYHFEKHCGCAPYSYNIENKLKVCLPYDEVMCMKNKMTKADANGTTYLDLPLCAECHLACQKTKYVSYASYGDGFNEASMNWLKKETNYSQSYIRENIAIINIHFVELFYTSYTQVKATTILHTLNTLFGLNGLWFGMSTISLIELGLFLIKVSWIAVSRKRRHHLFEKKMSEKRKGEIMEEAVQEVEEARSKRNSLANLKSLDINELENEVYWYKNPHPCSDSSLDGVIQLAIDLNMPSRRPSAMSLPRISEDCEEGEQQDETDNENSELESEHGIKF